MAVIVRRATIHDSAAIAHVHVDTWRTTYKGIMTDEFLTNLSYQQREHNWENTLKDENVAIDVFVAEEDGQVVGFASCGPARDDKEFGGELYAIYVIQSYQGKGIGRALTSSVVRALRERGFGSMMVWVLADNPFRRFYEALGGKAMRAREVEIGGKTLKEQEYGWKNLDSVPS